MRGRSAAGCSRARTAGAARAPSTWAWPTHSQSKPWRLIPRLRPPSSTSSIRCRSFDRFVACCARQRPSWSRSPTDASPPRRPRSGSIRPTNSTSCSFARTSKPLADGSISRQRTGRRPPATRCTQCGRARDQDDELAFAARSRLHGAALVPLRACSYAKPIRTDCALGLWDEDGKPSRKTSPVWWPRTEEHRALEVDDRQRVALIPPTDLDRHGLRHTENRYVRIPGIRLGKPARYPRIAVG